MNISPFSILPTISGLKENDRGIWEPTDSSQSKVSYPDDGHDNYFEIEDRSFWFRHRNRVICSLAKTFLFRSQPILDVGGGNGYVTQGLQAEGFEVALLESGKRGVLNAQERGVSKIIHSSLIDAQFSPNIFPAIGIFDVLEHIQEDLEFLKSIRKILSEDGLLLLTVPAFNWLWSTEDRYAGHYRRYNKKSLKRVLEQSDFEILHQTYFFSFLIVPIFLFRTIPSLFKNPSAKKKASDKRDHERKSGIWDKIIQIMLDKEFLRLADLKKMHFGSSIFMVAKVKIKLDWINSVRSKNDF